MFEKWKRHAASHTSAGSTSAGHELRCSFCQKEQAHVRKLIAGPEVFICDECVDVCNDIIADDERVQNARKIDAPVQENSTPPRPPTNKVACSLCGTAMLPAEGLAIKGRGVLCGGCADAVEDALNEGRPTS
jgi:hypothetical protein